MEASRCISPPPQSRAVVIRTEYLRLAESLGDKITDKRCAAALLSAMEHWTNWKTDQWKREMRLRYELAERDERYKPRTSLWVFMSQREWREELLDLFSEKKIAKALFELELVGLIKSRSNPRRKTDRKRQYLLVVGAVQKQLDFLSGVQRNAFRQMAEWTPPNGRMQSAKRTNAKRQTAETISQTPSTVSNSQESTPSESSQPMVAPEKPDERDVVVLFQPYLGTFGHLKNEADALLKHIERLGAERALKVIDRCTKAGKTWAYVLAALEREIANPTPLPPSPGLAADDGLRYVSGPLAAFIRR